MSYPEPERPERPESSPEGLPDQVPDPDPEAQVPDPDPDPEGLPDPDFCPELIVRALEDNEEAPNIRIVPPATCLTKLRRLMIEREAFFGRFGFFIIIDRLLADVSVTNSLTSNDLVTGFVLSQLTVFLDPDLQRTFAFLR